MIFQAKYSIAIVLDITGQKLETELCTINQILKFASIFYVTG